MSDVTLLVRSLMTEAEAAPWVTPEELSYAATFGTDERRREFLSWRAVVRQELRRDVQIAYNELGAPILVGRAEQISVSHAKDLLVVALSTNRVGVRNKEPAIFSCVFNAANKRSYLNTADCK